MVPITLLGLLDAIRTSEINAPAPARLRVVIPQLVRLFGALFCLHRSRYHGSSKRLSFKRGFI